MPPAYFPLRWESTGDQWWFASPIDWAAANGHYDLVRELLHLDTNLLIKLTSLRRIRRLETVWDDEEQFDDVAKCRSQVARQLLLECETKKGHNSLIRAGYGGWLLYTAASAGDVGFVKELLDKNPFLVFGEGEYGVTDILYAAARSKNCEVFRLLLDSSLSRRDSANDGEEVEVQPQEVSSVFKWEMMNRAVHAAARGGNVEMLRELLGDSSDVLAYRDAQGSTVLHTASGRGQVEVVKSLLTSYDIINSTDNQGNTVLNVAAYRGHLAVVEVLISSSSSTVSLKNNYGDTFLHMAVAGFRSPGFRRLDRQIELMRQLVRGKIANIEDIINVRNNDGRTALHLAVIENIQSDLVELLMSVLGINLNIRDADGNTPLDLLKQRPRSASSEILIKRLIAAGGISNCQDHRTRSALVSHLKMQSIGGSPGTSFRIPDAEIFLYTGNENASDAGTDFASTDYDMRSGELSYCGSAAGSESYKTKFGSVNSAARRLKFLLYFPRRKEKKMENSANLDENASLESYRISSPEVKPISLRQRFSKMTSSLSTNKRIVALPNSLPSPSAKKKFAAGLMQGVIHVKRPKFKRKFDDLYVEQSLNLTEALCGFQFVLTHLDSRQLLVKSSPGEVVKPDQYKAINDEGMPHYQRPFMKGRLFIHFNVEFPESGTLSSDKRHLLKSILPSGSLKQSSDMDLDECEETTLHDVNIEEEMRQKQHKRHQEAYDEDDDDDDEPTMHRMACNQQ